MTSPAIQTVTFIDDNMMSPDSVGDGRVKAIVMQDEREVWVDSAALVTMARWLLEAGLLDGGGADDQTAALDIIQSPAGSPGWYNVVESGYGGWDNFLDMTEQDRDPGYRA